MWKKAVDVEEGGDGGINYILVAAVAVIVLALVVFFLGKIPGTSGRVNKISTKVIVSAGK